uniref:Uncharacterized protein n=1 Tax=Wuchereria bancrofti TaxID=6293 RepID=A0A1I8F0Z3_WUCBA
MASDVVFAVPYEDSYTLLYITDTSWSNRWTCVDGLNENETPFSFGGALYSLKISWRIAIPDIIEAVSPIDVNIHHFCLDETFLDVTFIKRVCSTVRHSSLSELQTDCNQLIVTVTEPLQLTVPPRYHQALRLSPDAKLDLKRNKYPHKELYIYQAPTSSYFLQRKVVSAKSLRFSSVPQFVSNIRDHQYVFPLIDDSIEQNPSNTYELILDAPSDCTIGFVEKVNVLAISLFAARSTFLPTLGKYGWGPVSLNDYQSLSLNISATWNHVGKVRTIRHSFFFLLLFTVFLILKVAATLASKVKEVSLIVTFYPRFEIT